MVDKTLVELALEEREASKKRAKELDDSSKKLYERAQSESEEAHKLCTRIEVLNALIYSMRRDDPAMGNTD